LRRRLSGAGALRRVRLTGTALSDMVVDTFRFLVQMQIAGLRRIRCSDTLRNTPQPGHAFAYFL
jgi:hypothetical protein